MAAREKPGPPMTLGNMRRRPRAYSNVPSLRAQSRRERGRFGSNDLRSGGRPKFGAANAEGNGSIPGQRGIRGR
jgi:hypothetical protein